MPAVCGEAVSAKQQSGSSQPVMNCSASPYFLWPVDPAQVRRDYALILVNPEAAQRRPFLARYLSKPHACIVANDTTNFSNWQQMMQIVMMRRM